MSYLQSPYHRPSLIKKLVYLERELAQINQQGNFVSKVNQIRGILNSESVASLLRAVKKVYQSTMGVKGVSFFLIDEEVVNLLKQEGVESSKVVI